MVTDPKSQGFSLGPRFKLWCHLDELGNVSKRDFSVISAPAEAGWLVQRLVWGI